MTVVVPRLRHAVVAAGMALCWGLTWAASPAVTHDQARELLREGKYGQVVAITRQLSLADPSHALNWYRMAIAASRTGEFELASEAIARAQALEPRLTFASTPGHVERLKATIQRGLVGGGPAAAVGPTAPAAAGAAPAIATVPPSTAAPGAQQPVFDPQDPLDPAATVAAVQATMREVSRKLETLDASVRANARTVEQAQAAWASNTLRDVGPWLVGFLLLVLSGLAWLVVRLRHNLTELRRARADKLATMPLDDIMRYTLDATSTLSERLKLHNHADKDIYVQLQRVLPALERECGRARTDVQAATRGIAVLDTTADLRPKDPLLGHADPRSLHSMAASAALRGKVAAAAQPPQAAVVAQRPPAEVGGMLQRVA